MYSFKMFNNLVGSPGQKPLGPVKSWIKIMDQKSWHGSISGCYSKFTSCNWRKIIQKAAICF